MCVTLPLLHIYFLPFIYNHYESQVRTFDAKEFAYEPSECWNAMSIDMSPNERGALLVRHTGQWEVRIIWNAEALVIDMTPTNFIVSPVNPFVIIIIYFLLIA